MAAKTKYLLSKEHLERDYSEVKSLYALAKKYKIPRLAILYWMRKYNIQRVERISQKFFIASEQLRTDYQELKSLSKIAHKYGVSKKLVLNYMNRYGIKRKDPIPISPLREMASLGVTAQKAGQALGIGANYVTFLARRNGFKFIDPFHPGYITRKKGYVMRYAYRHPYKNTRNCVMEHRLVCEGCLGRYLTPDEVVHHINRNPADNRAENLIVLSKSDHVSLHSRERKKKHHGRQIKRLPHS